MNRCAFCIKPAVIKQTPEAGSLQVCGSTGCRRNFVSALRGHALRLHASARQPLITPPTTGVDRRPTAPDIKDKRPPQLNPSKFPAKLVSRQLREYEDWVLSLPVLPPIGKNYHDYADRVESFDVPVDGDYTKLDNKITQSGLQWYRCEAILLDNTFCPTISLMAPFCNTHLRDILGVSVEEIPEKGCGLVVRTPNEALRVRNLAHPFTRNQVRFTKTGRIFGPTDRIVPYCGKYFNNAQFAKVLHDESRYVVERSDINIDAWRTGFGPARYANFASDSHGKRMLPELAAKGIKFATAVLTQSKADIDRGDHNHPVVWIQCDNTYLYDGDEITYNYCGNKFKRTERLTEQDFAFEAKQCLAPANVKWAPTVSVCDLGVLVDDKAASPEE